jgi:hypothetical protein
MVNSFAVYLTILSLMQAIRFILEGFDNSGVRRMREKAV